MWIEKLVDGVLEVETPVGPRYVQPSFLERVYLIWTFRNFPSLPQQVLLPWEQRLISRLWSDNRFVPVSAIDGPNKPIIGRIERRVALPAETTPSRPASTVSVKVPEAKREVAPV